jgi:hypothetical protein
MANGWIPRKMIFIIWPWCRFDVDIHSSNILSLSLSSHTRGPIIGCTNKTAHRIDRSI